MEDDEEENGQGEENPQGESTGINPAWNDLLSSIPEENHSQVIPHLQNWDKNVQERFDEYNSRYEDWEPFVESEVDPEEVNFALGLLNAVNNNPQGVAEALGDWLGENNDEDSNSNDEGKPTMNNEDQGSNKSNAMDLSNNSDYTSLKDTVNSMAEIMVNQQDQDQEQQEDAELEQEFSNLHDEFGDFDEGFVLSRMVSGSSGEDAVEEYNEFVQDLVKNQRESGPTVIGSSSSFESPSIDPKTLDEKGRRQMIAQRLEQLSQDQ